jgi:hypothetical protein
MGYREVDVDMLGELFPDPGLALEWAVNVTGGSRSTDFKAYLAVPGMM